MTSLMRLNNKPMKNFHSENILCVMELRKSGNILVPFLLLSLVIISTESSKISVVFSGVEHKLSSLSN